MKLWKNLCVIGIAVVLGMVLFGYAGAVDAPHDEFNIPQVCGGCHISHGGSYPSLMGQLCESCHFEGGPAPAVQTHSSITTRNAYGNWHLYCWDCHDPHTQRQDRTYGTTYGMFIRVNLDGYIVTVDPDDPDCVLNYCAPIGTHSLVLGSSVRFTGPSEYVDGDADYADDICRVCHVQTSYYNIVDNSHADYGTDTQPEGDCLSCHTHEGGFSPAAGGCTGCHSTAQPDSGPYRRQVTGTGGDFLRVSHHVDDAGGSYEVADADCEVCHDQSNHQANAEPSVLLYNGDGGTGYTYDGTGASLEAFCLSCHDADGYTADLGQPFGSGTSPADIASSWVSSPHDINLTAEACLSCHGGDDSTRSGLDYAQNVHGSSLPSLVSPTVAGEAASVVSEVCWGCHDSDGPASIDIEGQFADVSTTKFTSDNGGALNAHHDVTSADQAYSGALMSCANCHDTHANTLLTDPDPGDGSVPTAGNSWSGSSWESEFCLDCHDNTYPATLTPPTNALVDISTVFTDTRGDQHGAGTAGKNVSLRSGSGYARGDILECTACHNPGHGDTVNGTARPNAANLRSVIYSADGTTPLTPDTVCVTGEPYTVLLNDPAGPDTCTNGQVWCSTCHPNPMGGNKDSGCIAGSCHNHGMGSF